MELLVFGHGGSPVIFFPPRLARFYDYENWGIVESVRTKIDAGLIQLFCVDSYDHKSLYNHFIAPKDRILNHIRYEKYILNEVIPLAQLINNNNYLVSAGCSLGAFHAVNIALRHPRYFNKVVGLSGRYDLTKPAVHYVDLFNGYHDQNIYFNTPTQYMANLTDERILHEQRKIDFIFAVGHDDPCLPCNKYLSSVLTENGINNHLFVWDEEAHKAYYWRKMVPIYL